MFMFGSKQLHQRVKVAGPEGAFMRSILTCLPTPAASDGRRKVLARWLGDGSSV